MDDDLARFLSPLTAFAEETRIWRSLGTLRIACYLTDKTPPHRHVTSARAVVIQSDQVMLVRDPYSSHITPGGRLEPGEALEDALRREVVEETGWSLAFWKPIGILHFTNIDPAREAQQTQPDFLQVVYAGTPGEYHPELKEVDGFELDSKFVPIDQVRQVPLGMGQQTFLETAVRTISNHQGTSSITPQNHRI